jgi:hypothetical protein
VAVALLAGCATSTTSSTSSSALGSGTGVTVTDASRLTRTGFLKDYGRLKATPESGGLECWRDPGLDARKYDKVLISRIVVSFKEREGEAPLVDPTDLKALTDYFHDSLAKALKPQMPVVDKAGPGVVVIRIALTHLVPTGVSRSVTGTLIPYGFVAEAGSGPASGRPAGATPYMGETGMEIQFVDGASNAVIGECRDTQIGRKYASDVESGTTGAAQTWASGYLNSFQAWAYAKNAFDKWSAIIAQRFAQLRGK